MVLDGRLLTAEEFACAYACVLAVKRDMKTVKRDQKKKTKK
jgi:hypothetical protein